MLLPHQVICTLLVSYPDEKVAGEIESKIRETVDQDFQDALNAEDPSPSSIHDHIFAETDITKETGQRYNPDSEPTVMVDCALHAIEELMRKHDECLLPRERAGLPSMPSR